MATYLIPECNLAELESRIEKLNKRAARLGVALIQFSKTFNHVKARVRVLTVHCEMNSCWELPEKIAERNAKWPCEDTGERMAWFSVNVEGSTPVLPGWEFIAILEPMVTDDGSVLNLIQKLPGKDCPSQYRDNVGNCDHCNTLRRRKQTFVLQNVDGSYKCVGRQCIKDFLGYHGDPQQLASWAEMLAQLETLCSEASDEDWMGGGSRQADCWDLKRFLTLTACRIRMFGWLSKGKAYETGKGTPTANSVLELLTPPGRYATENEKIEWKQFCAKHVEIEDDAKQAEAAIEWAKELDSVEIEASDYLANINLVARVGTASRKTSGLAASIIVAHAKAIEKEIKKQEAANRPESHHVGTVGERIKLITLKCEKIIRSESAWGLTGIHKLTDEAGNDLVWFASGSDWFKEGETLSVSASVKKHDEYQGRKQTIITRVTIWTEEAVAAYKAKEEKKAARLAKKLAK